MKDLATYTLGAVVQPGAVLMNLVPQNEPLFAEVAIRNEDVGFVAPGQAVKEAEIHQGNRSVLEYLLSPVQKIAAEAGREQ